MLLLLFSFLLSTTVVPITAEYDIFTFNMSLLCRHDKQYTWEVSFNILNEDPTVKVSRGEMGSLSGTANGGMKKIDYTGFYNFELSRAPVWEPVVEIKHTCMKEKGFKTLKLQFGHSPALRNKTRYIYKYFIDITDKEGDHLADAEVTSVTPSTPK